MQSLERQQALLALFYPSDSLSAAAISSACREGGSLGKSNGKIGSFRLNPVARLSAIAP
jgi:hypothetical protein